MRVGSRRSRAGYHNHGPSRRHYTAQADSEYQATRFFDLPLEPIMSTAESLAKKKRVRAGHLRLLGDG